MNPNGTYREFLEFKFSSAEEGTEFVSCLQAKYPWLRRVLDGAIPDGFSLSLCRDHGLGIVPNSPSRLVPTVDAFPPSLDDAKGHGLKGCGRPEDHGSRVLLGPYTLKMVGDINRCQIFISVKGHSRISIKDRKDRDFLAALVQWENEGWPLGYDIACRILMEKMEFQKKQAHIATEKERLLEEEPSDSRDMERHISRLWGKAAHKPVSRFRTRLAKIGLNPREILRNVPKEGYVLVCGVEKEGGPRKRRNQEVDSLHPDQLLREDDKKRASPDVGKDDF